MARVILLTIPFVLVVNCSSAEDNIIQSGIQEYVESDLSWALPKSYAVNAQYDATSKSIDVSVSLTGDSYKLTVGEKDGSKVSIDGNVDVSTADIPIKVKFTSDLSSGPYSVGTSVKIGTSAGISGNVGITLKGHKTAVEKIVGTAEISGFIQKMSVHASTQILATSTTLNTIIASTSVGPVTLDATVNIISKSQYLSASVALPSIFASGGVDVTEGAVTGFDISASVCDVSATTHIEFQGKKSISLKSQIEQVSVKFDVELDASNSPTVTVGLVSSYWSGSMLWGSPDNYEIQVKVTFDKGSAEAVIRNYGTNSLSGELQITEDISINANVDVEQETGVTASVEITTPLITAQVNLQNLESTEFTVTFNNEIIYGSLETMIQGSEVDMSLTIGTYWDDGYLLVSYADDILSGNLGITLNNFKSTISLDSKLQGSIDISILKDQLSLYISLDTSGNVILDVSDQLRSTSFFDLETANYKILN